MRTLRKLIAIVLLAVFSLPFASTLFALAPKSDTNLPACCRRDGKHHCMQAMTATGAVQSDEMRFSAPLEKCPYCPGTVTADHGRDMMNPSAAQVLLVSFTGPSGVVKEAESKRRVSCDRSRQKRGPPSMALPQLS